MNVTEDNDARRSDGHSNSDFAEEYFPECDADKKPYVGRKFISLKVVEDFYHDYGAACGFDVRLGQIKRAYDRTIITRYMYCNREGVKASYTGEKGDDSQKKRKTLTMRVSCNAKITLRYCGRDGYVVDAFHEGYKYPFVSEQYTHFLKCKRNLDDVHQSFILNCEKTNIGCMKSFRLFKEIVGGYSNIGCSSVEFRNFSCDLKAYVEGVDAQILLDKFHNKKEIFLDFTYYYSVNDSEKLTRIFWADTTSIKMYHMFGHVVSLDATYSTNKYNMVFTPFTEKDNHGRCVTFGAALLTSEDTDSYTWLLEKFIECMKVSPSMIITDQDPALKITVERVMPDTNHRFCMWHIMNKVAKKIPVSLTENEGFAKKFNDIVWSETIKPVDFEIQWNEIMEEYDLLDIDWFATMFELREFWIPAYFKDMPMAGLFRTTSMSESENSFFQRYINRNANLLTFFMHFDSAIDAQRDAHDKLSSVDETSTPKTHSDCLFEKHATSVYTTKIFQNVVQKEIRWCTTECKILNLFHGHTVTTYEIEDSWLNRVFKVEVNVPEETYDCECKHFHKHGLLCRHVYVVLKNDLVRVIPQKYIMPRWTRYACSDVLAANGRKNTEGPLEKLYLLNMLHQSCKKSIRLVGGDVDRMKELLEDFNALTVKYKNDGDKDTDKSTKQKGFESFYGAPIPEEVSVLPPDPVKTKGSGSGSGSASRIQSQREKAIKEANKKKQKCGKCGKLANHDSRNCPFAV